MAGIIAQSKYEQMKKETGDVVDIFFDDTADSQQTIQIISQIAEAAIAVQGMGEVPDSGDKAKVGGLILLDIAVEKLRAAVVVEGQ